MRPARSPRCPRPVRRLGVCDHPLRRQIWHRYGGYQLGCPFLPDIIRGFQNKSIIKIRNPESIRPWQFVLDPLFGYLRLVEKMWDDGVKFSQGWNFGPTIDEEKTVRWITEFTKRQIDEKINFEKDISSQPHEEKYLRLDCSKAINQLDWKSKMGLENTLLWTINWYKEFMKGNNMKKFTESQIDEFNA